MPQYLITTHMPGYLSESDAEPFTATPEDAISALIDEALFQLDGIDGADEDEALDSDLAFVESLRGYEGRTDLLAGLLEYGAATIRLESYANSFGGVVTLALAEEQDEDGEDNYPSGWMGSAGPA